MTIKLGTGTYASGGNLLTTSNQNLTLIADAITGFNDNGIVFALGTGTITVTGKAAADMDGGETNFYDYHPTNSRNLGSKIASNPNNTGAIWKFYGTSVSAADRAAVSNTVWMSTTTLTAGKVVKEVTPLVITKSGLDVRSNLGNNIGNIKFRTAQNINTADEQINLQAGHDVVFVKIGIAGTPFSTTGLSPLPVAKSIVFDGANFFSGDLTLNATGSITQTSGAGNTLSVTGGKLIVTGSSAITLNNSGNGLGSLGALNSSGSIGITTGAA